MSIKKLFLDKQAKIPTGTITGIPAKMNSKQRTSLLKIISVDRGTRLRILRFLEKMTPSEFSGLLNINEGTLGRMERGTTCCPLVSAYKVCLSMLSLGILVPIKWLLSGTTKKLRLVESNRLGLEDLENKYNNPIMNLYDKLQQNILVHNITDNSMLPYYSMGDYVAGKILHPNEFDTLQSTICIINTGNKQVVRMVSMSNNQLAVSEVNSNNIELMDPINITIAPVILFTSN